MKRAIVIAAFALHAIAIGMPQGAAAATKCTTMTCLENAVLMLQGQVGTLQTQVGSLQTNVTALQKQVGALQTNVSKLQSSNSTLQTQVQKLNANPALSLGPFVQVIDGKLNGVAGPNIILSRMNLHLQDGSAPPMTAPRPIPGRN